MKANAAKAAPFGREHVNRQTYTCAGVKKKRERLFNLIRVCVYIYKILCTRIKNENSREFLKSD